MSGNRTAQADGSLFAFTVAELLDLIDGLDRINEDSYLDLTRWDRKGNGEDDERLTMAVRQLARERLDTFAVEDVGMEILRQIDQRKPRYGS